jgi:hypothetical protein
MKKIITTLTAVTFALGLAAAAQAQVAKTPEKPVVQGTQAVQTQVAPKETVKPGEPVAKETVKPGDKTKEAAQAGDKGNVKKEAKKEVKKEAKQAAKKSTIEKKAGANLETTPKDAK